MDNDVDSHIPYEALEDGKRFGFVRFINDGSMWRRLVNKIMYDLVESFANSMPYIAQGVNRSEEWETNTRLLRSEETRGSLSQIPRILSNSLIGKLNRSWALIKLKKVTCENEVLIDIFVRYMGELWVLLEFDNTKAKELFLDNVGVGSWFSVLRQASHDFTPKGRIACVDVEGIPFNFFIRKNV
ncbi:hypothetical protein Tco_0337806 [Tanacetum coccineum]